MTRSEKDEAQEKAWRAIVENYGERVELDPDASETLEAQELSSEDEPEPEQPKRGLPDPSLFGVVEVPRELADVEAEDRFVPPPPPPLPRLSQDRLIAWGGLFGSPTLLLLALVTGFRIPTLIAYLLVAWFLGGFGYLVWQMPKGPADPWDDGARL